MDPQGLEFTEDDWFDELTLGLVDLRTPGRADNNGLSQLGDPPTDLSDREEWLGTPPSKEFTSLTQSFTTLEDSVVVLEPVGRAGTIVSTAAVQEEHGQE